MELNEAIVFSFIGITLIYMAYRFGYNLGSKSFHEFDFRNHEYDVYFKSGNSDQELIENISDILIENRALHASLKSMGVNEENLILMVESNKKRLKAKNEEM